MDKTVKTDRMVKTDRTVQLDKTVKKETKETKGIPHLQTSRYRIF
jgi:hypothetical protein